MKTLSFQMDNMNPKDVLDFWFCEITPEQWWKSDPAFDRLIESRFLDVLQQAARGELSAWRQNAEGRLAEILVLDQFSRNVWRNTSWAFAQDAVALVLAQEAISAGVLSVIGADARAFLLMPFMHSESQAIHAEAEVLFREHAPGNNYEFELKHKVIIDRFGRYPHRNAILGRPSTEEEVEFLQQPGSSF